MDMHNHNPYCISILFLAVAVLGWISCTMALVAWSFPFVYIWAALKVRVTVSVSVRVRVRVRITCWCCYCYSVIYYRFSSRRVGNMVHS